MSALEQLRAEICAWPKWVHLLAQLVHLLVLFGLALLARYVVHLTDVDAAQRLLRRSPERAEERRKANGWRLARFRKWTLVLIAVVSALLGVLGLAYAGAALAGGATMSAFELRGYIIATVGAMAAALLFSVGPGSGLFQRQGDDH